MLKDRAWLYIAIVLPVSWIVQYVLFSGMLPAEYLGYYMYVPALLAFIFFLFGKEPLKAQWKLFISPTKLWPWVFALLYPLGWLALVSLIAVVTGLGKFEPAALATIFSWGFFTNLATLALLMTPAIFGEEYGWRGFLLPALAEKRTRLRATVIVGAVWGLWHIPSYYLTFSQVGLGDPLLLTILSVVNVAIGAFPYTYLFLQNGNLLPCILFHALYDKTAAVLFISASGHTGPVAGSPGLVTIYWPHSLILIAATGLLLAGFFAWRWNKENAAKA